MLYARHGTCDASSKPPEGLGDDFYLLVFAAQRMTAISRGSGAPFLTEDAE